MNNNDLGLLLIGMMHSHFTPSEIGAKAKELVVGDSENPLNLALRLCNKYPGKRIEAIIEYREYTGKSLKACRDEITAMWDKVYGEE